MAHKWGRCSTPPSIVLLFGFLLLPMLFLCFSLLFHCSHFLFSFLVGPNLPQIHFLSKADGRFKKK